MTSLSRRAVGSSFFQAITFAVAFVSFSSRSQALPTSPNLDPAFTFYSLNCIAGDFQNGQSKTTPGGRPILGVASESCFGEINHGPNGVSQHSGFAETGVDEGSPYALAKASANSLGVRGTTATANLTYQFSISTKDPGPPRFFKVPMLIDARAGVFANVNAQGLAQVTFYNTVRPGILFRLEASVNILDNDADIDDTLWAGLITTDEAYEFILDASCQIQPAGLGELVECNAVADPSIRFDQARFDQMMGENTFSLQDTYEVYYGPGFEHFEVPEPSTSWLFLSGLGLLGGIPRRRPGRGHCGQDVS